MKRRLAVLVPWDSPFMYMNFAFNMANLQHPEGWEVRYFIGQGWCPAARHNNALAKGINWGAHALMFLGADHICDEDILIKLIGHLEDGWDMATGWIPSRGMFGIDREWPFPKMAFVHNDLENERTKPKGAKASMSLGHDKSNVLKGNDTPSQEIHMIGTGTLMFKVEVVMDMKMPWFQEVLEGDALYSRHCVQDSYFVYRCTIENGFTLWLDTTIDQKHLQIFPIDETFEERFKDKAGTRWNPVMHLNAHPDETGFDEDGELTTKNRAISFEGGTHEDEG